MKVWVVLYDEVGGGVNYVVSYPVDGAEEFEVEEPDLCGVCGDDGVYGLCSDCARLSAKSALWNREDLDDWLQDKGLNPARHITSGTFRVERRGYPGLTAINRGFFGGAVIEPCSSPLTEYRP